jgi:hypothetical protein
VASQSCGWVPLQVRLPGVHDPAHTPLEQTNWHAEPLFAQ